MFEVHYRRYQAISESAKLERENAVKEESKRAESMKPKYKSLFSTLLQHTDIDS